MLRQITYLAPHYDLLVAGYGARPAACDAPGVQWVALPEPLRYTRIHALRDLLALGVGSRTALGLNDLWHRTRPESLAAWQLLRGESFAAIHANDFHALAVGARLAGSWGARLVVDLHEHSPGEHEQRLVWRWIHADARRALLRRYASQIDAAITVCAPIARLYQNEVGLAPIVIRNTPDLAAAADHHVAGARFQLLHHGAAIRARRLEDAITTVALLDARFTLEFLLTGDGVYIAELEALAARVAPGRVVFSPPVPPAQIVARIAVADIGLCVIPPVNTNYRLALPNKLFDALGAGLALAIGPSPAMAEVVAQYNCGVIAADFTPHAMAAALGALTPDALTHLRAGARRAAQDLNAGVEMPKLVALYDRLLRGGL